MDFIAPEVVSTLLDRVEGEMAGGGSGQLQTNAIFNRSTYDFEAEKTDVYELLERPYFRRSLRSWSGTTSS